MKDEWDAFCREKFQFWDGNKRKPLSGRHADRLINFARIREKLGPIGPRNESQSRDLAQFPEHLRASAMEALAAGGEITAPRIAELLAEVTASKDPAKVIARWRVEASKQRAASKARQRRQDSEASRKEKAIARVKKDLEAVRVIAVLKVKRVHTKLRGYVGIVDMESIDQILVSAAEQAEALAHTLALAIDKINESVATGAAEENSRAA